MREFLLRTGTVDCDDCELFYEYAVSLRLILSRSHSDTLLLLQTTFIVDAFLD